jgi:predicted HicB family RNase H-like nuclease
MAIDEVWITLTARIPKALHRKVQLYCVKADITMTSFVVAALTEKLKRDTARPRRST